MGVLSCRTVGIHGRDSLARGGLLSIGLVLVAAAALAQPASSPTDLAAELAPGIASLVPPASQLTIATTPTTGDAPLALGLERELTRVLTSRGFRIVPAGTAAAAAIQIGCGVNLRERTCVAEIRRGDARDIVAATRPLGARSPGAHDGPPLLAIELVPLFAQRAPILDVYASGDRLWVLDPAAIASYRRSGDEWQPIESRPIEPLHVWPRDVRGRLRAIGSTLEAFLPGVVCRTSLDLGNLSCVEQREPWPLALDNGGIDAQRNAFQTPEGVPFLSAADLDRSAGVRTATVAANRALVLMDDARSPVATIGIADDVASVTAACASGAYVVTSTPTAGARTDTLHAWRIADRSAVAAADPLVLSGRLTALWSASNAANAIAVVRDTDGHRHEAFQIRLSCAR